MDELASFDPAATRAAVGTIKLSLALIAAGLLGWAAVAQRRGGPDTGKRLRDGLLVVVALLSAAAWWNFSAFHYFSPDRHLAHVHDWDTYHYFVGTKYFDELRYTELYNCSAAASPDAWRIQGDNALWVRNLSNNQLEGLRVQDMKACKERFSPDRWRSFSADIAWFYSRIPNWKSVFHDWGFNATPVWITMGQTLIGDRPANARTLGWQTLVDVPVLALGFASVAWAFGWRTLCVLLVFWGTNFPADYSWTGGALLRHPWFGLLLGGISLLRRGHVFLGGFTLGTATALRVFPGAALAGLALLGAARLLRRDDGPALRRSLITGAGALCAMIGLALAAAPFTHGFSTWRDFAVNSAIDSVPSANNLGLKGVLAHRERDKWEMLKGLPDSVTRWEAARADALADRAAWQIVGVGAGLVLLGAATLRRRDEDWVAAVVALGVIPLAFHLASYYHVSIAVFALLASRQPAIGAALCLLAAFSQAAGSFPMENDERYVWLSIGWLSFVGVAATLALLPPQRDETATWEQTTSAPRGR